MSPGTLQAIYDAIPDVRCKGLCTVACGPIAMSRMEAKRIEKKTGSPLKTVAWIHESCPYLIEGKCSVYDVRPFICRLWGASEKMPCPWGCGPGLSREQTESIERLLEKDAASVMTIDLPRGLKSELNL